MTAMSKMIELGLRCHECYETLTLKYPVLYYSFEKKKAIVEELLEASTYIMGIGDFNPLATYDI
jgi:hypothetical protein